MTEAGRSYPSNLESRFILKNGREIFLRLSREVQYRLFLGPELFKGEQGIEVQHPRINIAPYLHRQVSQIIRDVYIL